MSDDILIDDREFLTPIYSLDKSGEVLYNGRHDPTKRFSTILKGGTGSGNFGHAGRPGEIGGSATGGLGGEPGGRTGLPQTPAPAKAVGSGRPPANPETQRIAAAYAASVGLPSPDHSQYLQVTEATGREIAAAYDALPVDDGATPAVRESFEALATEVDAQYAFCVAQGITFTPWTKDGQPYKDSLEMAADVRDHKRLFFYTGGDPNPVMARRDPVSGLTVNDKFRAVHDYFGHTAGGFGFGARGEENAWHAHSQMFSDTARKAMTTETRGQNSWVNFGSQNYNADGTYKNIPAVDRPFATQKMALLPERFVTKRTA